MVVRGDQNRTKLSTVRPVKLACTYLSGLLLPLPSLINKDEYYFPTELWHNLGPSARSCFEPWLRKTNDPITDLGLTQIVEDALPLDSSQCANGLKGGQDTRSQNQYHKLFTVLPKTPFLVNDTYYPCALHVIPTSILAKLASKRLQELEDNVYAAYAARFVSEPLVAGVAYEARVLRDIAKNGGTVSIGQDSLRYPPCPSQVLFDQTQAPRNNVLYVPIRGFASIDAFMFFDHTILVFQITIAQSHAKNTVGLEKIVTYFKKQLPTKFQQLSWVFVYIVPSEQMGQTHCHSLKSSSDLSKQVRFKIGHGILSLEAHVQNRLSVRSSCLFTIQV